MKKDSIMTFIIGVMLLFCGMSLQAQAVFVEFDQLKQEIDGFGASTAWHAQITNAEADAAFGNETIHQMGLSILIPGLKKQKPLFTRILPEIIFRYHQIKGLRTWKY